MTLLAGARLGPYEILAPLGAGGMGEVYRARDSRLSREVAVKVLPAAVAKDRDRVARFEQEARAASALNHPHIVTIHDIGRSDDTVYIAMELVDGETLGRMTAAGPMPVRRLLAVAAQVAEGLAKAHSAGIVHRDLKPENVMVSSDGFVKILDFGLAKLVAGPSDSHSGLPTQGPPQTHPGTVLGTVGYMSPEQAAGLPLDFRTDQFSFGSILYEMATGKRAFLRATSVDTLAAILHEEPEPIARVTPAAPAPLRWIVDRCLEKDPKARYASTLDLARELGSVRDHVSELSGGASTLSSETRHRSRGRLLAGGLAAAALLVGLAAGYLLRGKEGHAATPASRRILNLALTPGEELVLAAFPSLAISPDGSRVVYRGRSGSMDALYVRSLDSLDAKRLPGTEGAVAPFFSPDGAWVGFGADGKLKKVALSGGPPQTLCDAPVLRGASWGEGGTIVFAPTSASGLSRVAENGGAPAAVTTLDKERGEKTHRFPLILPGGKAAILTVHNLTGDYERARIDAVSLETGKRQVVLEGATDPRYLPTGHLLYLRGKSLFAIAFDAAALRATGSPVPVLDDIWNFQTAGFAQMALSTSGDLVYLPSDPLALEKELVWMDRKGAARPLSDIRRNYVAPRLSPDGRRLAITVYEKGSIAIWIYDLARNAWEQLTTGEGAVPVWSPDGKRIAFGSNRAGSYNIFVAPTDRSVPVRQVTKAETWPFAQAWSPDGRLLLFAESPGGSGTDLGVVSPDGNGEMKPLFRLPSTEGDARISPDGAWMAYQSDESGRFEVYLTRFPQPTGRTQVSTEGGRSPAWSKDGREVFFRNGNRLMAADVVLGSEPRAGVPRLLFEKEFEEFDPAPEGQSFVVLRRAHPNLPQKPLAVVLGFSDDVTRQMAAAKK